MESQPPPPAQLRYEATAGFVRILDVTRCTLAISVYMSNRVILLGADNNRIHIGSVLRVDAERRTAD
jgi:hypothetical protein